MFRNVGTDALRSKTRTDLVVQRGLTHRIGNRGGLNSVRTKQTVSVLGTFNGTQKSTRSMAKRGFRLHAVLEDTDLSLDNTDKGNVLASNIPEVMGYVHSMESFTAVDGPGVRFLCFLQGCGFRCVFCSNPDTWQLKKGQPISSKAVARRLERLVPYLTAGSRNAEHMRLHATDLHDFSQYPGGITLSGGEPLLQPDFCSALFQEAHARGLTTCLDTTGQGTKAHNWDPVLPHTDYVLICIKAIDPEKYQFITGHKQDSVLRFIDELETRGIPYWLRYVFAPGVTDTDQDVHDLVQFCADKGKLQAVEVLPYHTLGTEKWTKLGIEYPMSHQRVPTKEETSAFVDKLQSQGVPVLCAGVN